jgi:RNA polymerase sigma factor (TIGR02999 family)
VSPLSTNQVTELLMKWRQGDQQALDTLMPLVYNELRRVAHYYLAGERSDHTLQSTALVHEAYMRLVGQNIQLHDRAHFFAVASHLMRQILVDYARGHQAAKRDGGHKLALDEAVDFSITREVDLVALDDALLELSRMDPRQSRIVELRFFGGLSLAETAQVLSVSTATVERDWALARAWLYREISKTASV